MPGNHDVTNNLLVKKWKSLYGRTYYHFIYKDVLFLVLNSEEKDGERISSAQANYFKEVLETYPDVKQTIMLIHNPVWRDDRQKNFQKIEEWLKNRPYTVFAGHTHHYQKTVRRGRVYYVLSTTGGGSNLQGPAFGEFDQIALVRSSGRETSVVNLELNGILANDVVTDDDVIENPFRNYWEKDGMEVRFRFPVVHEPKGHKELTLGFSPLEGDMYPSFRTSDPLFAAIPLTSKVEKGGVHNHPDTPYPITGILYPPVYKIIFSPNYCL
ncbi:MAG TPA: hypothetical protein VK957_04280 [Lunatimonas sp.]|nr:hypothetical protein [Lunatimonas sp.]